LGIEGPTSFVVWLRIEILAAQSGMRFTDRREFFVEPNELLPDSI
jgi:hypothetical protein